MNNEPATWTQQFIRIVLAIAPLAIAMLLPFLPGRHDPLVISLSAAATGVAFGSLLLVPIGLAWLISSRGYALARLGLVVATLVASGAALATAASGSITAAVFVLAAWLIWLARLWRRVGAARAARVDLARAVPIVLIAVPLGVMAVRRTLVEPAAAWSRDRAIANSVEMISDIERFREHWGAYPVALNSVWPDYHPGIIGIERYRYEPNGESYSLYFEHPSTDLAVREIVMYNPRGEQDISSHALDLLQLSPEVIRRQRGYFASHDLPQAGWKRFLFD